VVTASLTGALLLWMSWQWIFALYAIPGLLWALYFWVWFRDRPQDHSMVNAGEGAVIQGFELPNLPTSSEPREPTPSARLLTSGKTWAICGQQFFRAAGYMFFTSWFVTYLRQTRGVEALEASLMTSLPLLGVVVGTLLAGFVSDRLYAWTGSLAVARKWL